MKHTPDDVFRSLKPVALDTRAAEAYARRRPHDLDRVMAAASGESMAGDLTTRPARPRRIRRVLVAGLAAGAVAAAGVVVATGGSDGRAPSRRPPTTRQRVDARTFLLASAESVAKSPNRTGACWYTRVRETVRYDGAALRKIRSKVPARIRSKRRVPDAPAVTAYISRTQETWTGRDRHDRTITGIDREVTFPSRAEEAKWKALGSPELESWSAKRSVHDYDFSHIKLTKTQRELSIPSLTGLPSDPAALKKVMRGWYRDQNREARNVDGEPTGDSFPMFLFGTAQDLLAGPVPPRAKAALYRLLAEQPGIRYLGTTTDRLGRRGEMIAMTAGGRFPSDGEIRLVIDPGTGQLLEQRSGDGAPPALTMTYQTMGWVGHLGDRP